MVAKSTPFKRLSPLFGGLSLIKAHFRLLAREKKFNVNGYT
jgi:hypothetical protein